MHNKRNITSEWLYPNNMQTKIFAESQLDHIIHSASAKNTIDPNTQLTNSVIKQRRNKHFQTDSVVMRNIIKNEIWNPLIKQRYSPRSRSLQNTHKKLESLGLQTSNYRIKYMTSQSQSKSIVKLKQELIPFFTDIKINKIKREDGEKKRNNSTFLHNKHMSQQQTTTNKNLGLFKIHQIEWRRRPKPTYSSLQEELVNNQ